MRGTYTRPGYWFRVVSLLVLACAGILATGATRVARASARTAQASSSGHVTVIVLDMSGSMAQNDPNGLRCSATNAYVDLSGPGDYIGVIGLNNSTGARGGPHNFPTTVDWGLSPRQMATVADRQALRAAIQKQSNNCRPDAATPTYDSLAQAEKMLTAATQGGKISGSVILLTDGNPDPNTQSQISAIRQDLVPQFKAHNWPIDTIALGTDQGFHGFLSDISSATSGTFYTDGRGIVSGVSPLNVTPFFLNIFRLRNGRSPGPDIPPTSLDGGTTKRNFSVGQYVSHLDVVVVKDSPDAQVTIVAPDNERFPPAAAGTFISTDPHYAIFSIENPQQGPWEVDVSGNGLFLMDSLKVSTLGLAVSSPDPNVPLALGEPFTLTAQLTNQGTAISGGQFDLKGTLTYVGGDATTAHAQDILLNDPSGSGNYTATMTVPSNAPPGSYQITLRAQSASEDVLTTQVVVRFALFPSALLISPVTHKPTTERVGAGVVGWDAILRAIYRLPVVGWFGNLPLDGHPADPAAVVRGQVLLLGQSYASATVSAVATRAGTKTTIPVSVVNDGNGAFRLIFPTNASGSYAVTLTTTGAYNIAHGDLTHVARTVLVTITPATGSQEARAWILTLVYLLLLALLFLVLRALTAPPLVGMLVNSSGDGGEEFTRARRGAVARLLHPTIVTSEQMGLDPGLRFRFHRGGRITLRGARQRGNYLLNGEPVPAGEVSAAEAQITSADGAIAYTVTTSRGHGDDEEGTTPASWRQEVARRVRGRSSGGEDEETDPWGDNDDDRPRGRGLFRRKPAATRDDDWDDDQGGRGSRNARGSRRSRADDDDDDRSAAQRGRRQPRQAHDDDDW
ncbi:MAG: hypothetical protein IVW57_12730 [Ktedonobacterales bacterium]|nr:hypothetical protein [Ktedonobacterales bacterium]